MRIIFAGTPAFAVPSLERLLAEGKHEVVAVYTQPDRPAGRGRHLTASPVKEYALSRNLPVFQPISLRDVSVQEILRSHKADVMVVVAYGQLLPQAVLDIPRLGCINVHASRLPRWRGAAPIQRAILAGDLTTAVTIMRMDAGLDTGPILKWSREIRIGRQTTAAELHDALASQGGVTLLEVLDQLEQGNLVEQPQKEEGVTYAAKILKEEARLDWTQPAEFLDRQIRAFHPVPGAFTSVEGGALLKIGSAEIVMGIGKSVRPSPGRICQITSEGIDVETVTEGETLRLTEVQAAGGKRLQVLDFMNANPLALKVGTLFR